MNLYDAAPDIIRKAMVGRGMSASELAAAAGISSSVLADLLAGGSEDALPLLAGPLGLSGPALARHPGPWPRPALPVFVRRLELPFGDDSVNAWLLTSDSATLLIDTGWKPDDLADALGGIRPDLVLVTHGHRDHVGGVGRLSCEADTRIMGLAAGAEPFPENGLGVGPWTIRAVRLDGHADRALGFVIEGGFPTLFATGDAVFAGSMGGCPDRTAFETACRTLGAALDGCPPETILLPGHGQPTTLGTEWVRNPFAPCWGLA
jgi:glyoxylase-like metal-dependent hydrolase (beta-lactamase superfamily II)